MARTARSGSPLTGPSTPARSDMLPAEPNNRSAPPAAVESATGTATETAPVTATRGGVVEVDGVAVAASVVVEVSHGSV